tara:strand:- start:56 stop:673 length:618 start_codon:yes stop_codon:yes gene_type:complete
MGHWVSKDEVQTMIDKASASVSRASNNEQQWTLTFPQLSTLYSQSGIDLMCGTAREKNNTAAWVFCGVEKKGDETRHTDVVNIQTCWNSKEKYTVNRNDLKISMNACINDFKKLNCASLGENACRNTLGCLWDTSCSVSPEIKEIQTKRLQPLCTYYTHWQAPISHGIYSTEEQKNIIGPVNNVQILKPNLWECIRRREFGDRVM